MPNSWPDDAPKKLKFKDPKVYNGLQEGYQTWLNGIKIELQNHGVDHHRTNKVAPPAVAGDVSAEAKALHRQRLKNKRNIYTHIYGSLPAKLQNEVAADPYNGDPYATMAYVKTKCYKVSATTIRDLKEELKIFKMKPGEKLEATVS
jgi:hypothetical protein